MAKPELLMPAGDLEKAKIAFQFGADACYGSTSAYSMRTREIGFDYKTLKEAVDYAHSIGKKFYITLNTYPHELELTGLKKHAKKLLSMGPDAIILADPGIFAFVKKEIGKKKIEIHLSTQANTTNSESIKFWHKLGVKRFILAREVSLEEIKKIVKNVPKSAVIETFVHGAMCNSVSGRCNLSNYLTGRDANRGTCVQACRWEYYIVEKSRLMQPIPLEEDMIGSYIFNSKDLCMIEHLKELAGAGVQSFKVEGRNKSIYYAAIVARAYRKAIDNIDNKKILKQLAKELDTVTSRGYSTGFYFGKPSSEDINYTTSRPTSDWQFVGIIKDKSQETRNKKQTNSNLQNSNIKPSHSESAMADEESPPNSYHLKPNTYLVEGRNEIFPKENIEIVTPGDVVKIKVKKFISNKGEKLEKINPGYMFVLESKKDLPINSMIRLEK